MVKEGTAYTSTADLAGKTVVAEAGSAGEAAIQGDENLAKADYVSKSVQTDCLMEVAAGTADAAVLDLTLANAMIGEGTDYAGLKIVDELNAEEYGVAFRKGSDAAAAVDAALTDQAGSFFTPGGRYRAAEMHGNRYSVPVTLTGTPDAVTRAVEECSDPEAQTTWEVTDTELVLHKGVTGRTIDVAALTDALAERLGHLVSKDEPASYAPIEAQVTTAPPAAPDFDAIRSEVAAEPADAYLDKETREIVPSVTGVDFDTAQAQAVLDAAGEGETVSVPLLLTEPKLTTAKLEANLFKDVLGSGSTTCAGPSNRWYNIDLAAKRLNGTILLPGETFSYNDTVGPYTLASGYKAAGTYQNGQSVDATAGGICQLSSNLYWVTLKANLMKHLRKDQPAF